MNFVLHLVGRILLASIFVISGLAKIADWTGNSAYMAAQGMQLVPFFLAAAILVEIIGGLAIILNYKTRAIALLLFLYLIAVTLIFHDFWSVTGTERQTQMVHFLKNLSIMGGLLILAGQSSPRSPAG